MSTQLYLRKATYHRTKKLMVLLDWNYTLSSATVDTAGSTTSTVFSSSTAFGALLGVFFIYIFVGRMELFQTINFSNHSTRS